MKNSLKIAGLFAIIAFAVLSFAACGDNGVPAVITDTPMATPPAGTYNEAQNVALTCATEDADIYFTFGNGDPTVDGTLYSDPIAISQSKTIRAVATKTGLKDSKILVAEYIIILPPEKVAAPMATPPAGTYTNYQNISLSTATSGASIYYTLDESEPAKTSILYTGPVHITETTTIKAFAVKEGMTDSSVSSAKYIIKLPPARDDSLVSIVQSTKLNASELDLSDIKTMIKEAVDLIGGFGSIVRNGDTVVLKPNLVQPIDHTGPNWSGSALPKTVNGVTTDWRIAKAVAQLVREINPTGKIYIMEGASVTTSTAYNALDYTSANIPEVDAIWGIEEVSGSWRGGFGYSESEDYTIGRPELVRVKLENYLYREYYYFNKKLYEADVLINLPCLKTHHDAVVTGCIKNMSIGATPANIYGVNATRFDRNDMISHGVADFHKWIADYYTCRPVDLTIMDGLQGLQRGPSCARVMYGPDTGTLTDNQMNMRVILASKDGLAIDIVESNIMNWDYASVVYMKHLIDAGRVGNGDTKNITVLGKKVDDIRKDFIGLESGSNPSFTNGKKFTTEHKVLPSVSITSASFDGNNLNLNLNASANTDKIDVYIDSKYSGSVKFGFANSTISVTGLANGSHNIQVIAYTKYMYHAAAATTVTK